VTVPTLAAAEARLLEVGELHHRYDRIAACERLAALFGRHKFVSLADVEKIRPP
jgi:hypothetical protein